ncbi:MAG TPA: hypothetical protein VGQ90_05325, partial [Stellaceae bacterium]|nr:hypothetical protein [Stellaceae bacterium]
MLPSTILPCELGHRAAKFFSAGKLSSRAPLAQRSHVEVAGEAGVFLDVVEAQLGAAAHQGFD